MKILTALALLAGSLAAAPSAPAVSTTSALGSLSPRLSIDPSLPAKLAAGPTPVLFSWDERSTSRRAMADALEGSGVSAELLGAVSVGVACATSMADVLALGRVKGLRSVWADQQMATATDRSVPMAYNGPPSSVWGTGVTGRNVGLAVVDTGLDATHPDLEYGRRTKVNVRVLVEQPCPIPEVFTDDVYGIVRDLTGQDVPPLEDSELTSGHGTHIAGVAAGDGTTYRGMAPGATLVGIGATDSSNVSHSVVDPTTGTESVRVSTIGVVAGMNYVLVRALELGDVKTKVLLGGWVQNELYDPWHPMAEAIRDLADFGITVVLPAGNEGPEASDCAPGGSPDACHMNTWAASPHAITVAAAPKTSRVRLELYSSRGDARWFTDQDATFRYVPTLTAPGSNVISTRRIGVAPYVAGPGNVNGAQANPKNLRQKDRTDLQYQMLTGTSIAAAHVAGAVAVMQEAAVKAKGCYLTTQQVRSILEQTATTMPGYGVHEVGAGMIDATQAVALARIMPKVTSVESWMCPPVA